MIRLFRESLFIVILIDMSGMIRAVQRNEP
jgi:hypothetical protein